MLVDSHCHLDFPDFAGELDGVVARARSAGVGLMLTIGTSLDRFDGVRAIAEAYDDVFCSVGVHPHAADIEGDVAVSRLVAFAGHPKVVGIGETGLDYHYENSSREAQERSFRTHATAARETGLPLIVHTRAADADTIRVLREEVEKGPITGVLHCFNSNLALALDAIEIGFLVSFSGILTFKKADWLRDTATALPLDKLLVETDSPYLAPVPHRGRRNEPAYVADIAAIAAALKRVEPAEFAKRTTENFLRLFTRVGEAACA